MKTYSKIYRNYRNARERNIFDFLLRISVKRAWKNCFKKIKICIFRCIRMRGCAISGVQSAPKFRARYCAPRTETPCISADFDNPADTIIKVLLRNEKFTRDCRMQIWGSPISGRNGCGYIRGLPTVPVHRRRIEMPAPSVSAIAETTAARLSRSFAGRERMLCRAGMRRITLVRWYAFG